MNVTFDPATILTGMELWRKALDLQIPLSAEIRSHLLTMRRPILKSYVTAAQSYSSMLGCMEPTDGESALQLQRVSEAVAAFLQWSRDAQAELEKLNAE